MTFCVLCNQSSPSNTIQLRVGSHVCIACVSMREARLNQIRSDIHELETVRPPLNIWDKVGIAVFVLFTFLCILALFVHFLLSLFLGMLGLYLYGVTSRKSERKTEPFRELTKNKLAELNSEKSSIHSQLGSVYEQYWDIPPDWWWRRDQIIKRDDGRCRHCSRRRSGSRVPFHIHHVAPKFQREGNHRLENLILLCEICHSKIDEPGHHLVRGARKTRLKKEKITGRPRRRWRPYRQ